jgi:hypothetical protein
MLTHHNPVFIHEEGGYIEPTQNQNLGVVNAHKIFVDSRLRDLAAYPSANNFVVKTPTVYNNVYSIELISATIPIRPFPLMPSDEKYVVLELTGMRKNPRNIEATVVKDTTTKAPANSTSLFHEAFAVIPLIANGPTVDSTQWDRQDKHEFPHYFNPRAQEISEFRITLKQMSPTSAFGETGLYPLANVADATMIPDSEDEIQLLLEIKSSN